MKTFYSDGSTRGKNQKGADNIGGFGYVLLEDEDSLNILAFGCSTTNGTTNNREELKALIACFDYADEMFPNEFCTIYSDSAYVVNMVNDWIWKWAANGWKNSKKQTVENLDLVQEIFNHIKKDFYHCQVKKCSGHTGELGNEIADALATENFGKALKIIKEYNFIMDEEDWESLNGFNSLCYTKF